MKKLLLIASFSVAFATFGQVSNRTGINELIPEQVLHLGSQTGTIRVDGLNGTNNGYNGGEVGQTYPVYADSNGDLTLDVSVYNNSDGADAWSSGGLNDTVEILMSGADDGYEFTEMIAIPITVGRNVLLEVKYSVSIEVFQDAAENLVRDEAARNITNFFTLDETTFTSTTRRYSQSSRCYYNNNDKSWANNLSYTNTPFAGTVSNASPGVIYNTGSTYIPLTPGTHVLRFYGTVSSGISNYPTFVRFASGPDALFLRLH